VGNDVVIIDNKEGNGNTFDNLAQPLLDPPEGSLSYPVASNFPLQGFNSFLQIFIIRLLDHFGSIPLAFRYRWVPLTPHGRTNDN
jgi:hypothetical protein